MSLIRFVPFVGILNLRNVPAWWRGWGRDVSVLLQPDITPVVQVPPRELGEVEFRRALVEAQRLRAFAVVRQALAKNEARARFIPNLGTLWGLAAPVTIPLVVFAACVWIACACHRPSLFMHWFYQLFGWLA